MTIIFGIAFAAIMIGAAAEMIYYDRKEERDALRLAAESDPLRYP